MGNRNVLAEPSPNDEKIYQKFKFVVKTAVKRMMDTNFKLTNEEPEKKNFCGEKLSSPQENIYE